MKKIIIMITTLLVASLSPQFASAGIQFNTKLISLNHINIESIEAPKNHGEGSVVKSQCVTDLEANWGERQDNIYINYCDEKPFIDENAPQICSNIKSDTANNSVELNNFAYDCSSAVYNFRYPIGGFIAVNGLPVGSDPLRELESKILAEIEVLKNGGGGIAAPRF